MFLTGSATLNAIENAPHGEDPWGRLDKYRKNHTSQNGEDGIIEKLLEILPETPKVCLEVGAYDGMDMSNTYRLWNACGWKAILIEASTSRFAELEKNASGFPNVVTLNTMIEPTGKRSLFQLLSGLGQPTHLGVLSLDIDANELDFLENFDGMLADIVVLEFNYDFPPDVFYTDMPGDVFFRHSAKAVETMALRKGFRIVACTGPNAILVRNAALSQSAALQLPNLPIEALFDYAFLRKKYPSRAVVRSKLVSEDLAYLGVPKYWNSVALRATTLLRRIRRRFLGGSRQVTTTERRAHMRKNGFWI
jgi:hypothetical protein